jgi:hypothetical protein
MSRQPAPTVEDEFEKHASVANIIQSPRRGARPPIEVKSTPQALARPVDLHPFRARSPHCDSVTSPSVTLSLRRRTVTRLDQSTRSVVEPVG